MNGAQNGSLHHEFAVSLNKLWHKQSTGRWLHTPRVLCNWYDTIWGQLLVLYNTSLYSDVFHRKTNTCMKSEWSMGNQCKSVDCDILLADCLYIIKPWASAWRKYMLMFAIKGLLNQVACCVTMIMTQLAKIIGSTSMEHRSDAFVSDRCLIDVGPTVFAIWECTKHKNILLAHIYCT